MAPEVLPVARVAARVAEGGRNVPEQKVRDRYARLWPLIAIARDVADRATFYDNSRATRPFVVVAGGDDMGYNVQDNNENARVKVFGGNADGTLAGRKLIYHQRAGLPRRAHAHRVR